MWISPSSQKSKFDSFFQKSFFHYFYTLFRPNSAQQCWKHASPMLLIYSLGKRVPKTRLYTGRTCILSRAEFDSEKWKKCNFHHLDVRIRPNSAQKLSNSAHRFYIWKVHQKCYMATIYDFFISRTVVNLQTHQVRYKNQRVLYLMSINSKKRNGTWTCSKHVKHPSRSGDFELEPYDVSIKVIVKNVRGVKSKIDMG